MQKYTATNSISGCFKSLLSEKQEITIQTTYNMTIKHQKPKRKILSELELLKVKLQRN